MKGFDSLRIIIQLRFDFKDNKWEYLRLVPDKYGWFLGSVRQFLEGQAP